MTGIEAVSIMELLSRQERLFSCLWSFFISRIRNGLKKGCLERQKLETKTSMSLESIARPVAIEP